MSLFVALASPTATPTSHHPLSYHPSQPTLKETPDLWIFYSFWQVKKYFYMDFITTKKIFLSLEGNL